MAKNLNSYATSILGTVQQNTSNKQNDNYQYLVPSDGSGTLSQLAWRAGNVCESLQLFLYNLP